MKVDLPEQPPQTAEVEAADVTWDFRGILLGMERGLKIKTLGIITAGLWLLPINCALAEGFTFPSSQTNASPNKAWEIRCVKDSKQEGDFTLWIRNRKTGNERQIFTGQRYCEVLWKPDDSSLAITDWMGSNCSEILTLNLSGAGQAQSLAVDAARAHLSQAELTGHCYWEALRWQKDGRLRLRAFGHTDEPPSHQFLFEFIFDPTKHSVTVVQKQSGPHSNAEERT